MNEGTKYYLKSLIDEDTPEAMAILKLEINPNLKYIHTESQYYNNLDEKISYSKYWRNKVSNRGKIESFRVYQDINNGELIKTAEN